MNNINKTTSLLLMLLFTLGVIGSASAADISKLVMSKCAFCHGSDGNAIDGKSPSIAGGSIDYFVAVMDEYKTGDRPSISLNNFDMQGIAKALSDENIEALADYFAKQKFIPQKQKFDAELASAGKKLHRRYCEICHTEGGSLSEDDAGILAGQPMFYLQYSLDSYANGKRDMSKNMAKKFTAMQKKAGDKGILQLVHYYASQQ